MKSPNLDDAQTYRDLDPEGMLGRIGELPEQCQREWQSALKLDLPASYAKVDEVVILGMGGSAIGGDLLKGLFAAEARVPIIIHRDYHLPAFAGARTLVIACSCSGNTEETLTAFGEALKLKCPKLAITTGGKLKLMAQEAGVPLFTFKHDGQPRAALGSILLPLICFFQKLGFIGDKSAEVAEAVQALGATAKAMNERVVTDKNPAKQMAWRLYGQLPVIYGAEFLAEVAHRWKTQLNENAKAWAFYEVFPELDHNAVAGYQFPPEVAGQVRVVMLRSPLLGPRIRLRYELTARLLDRAGIGYEYVDATGNGPLSQALSTVLFGDYVSYYLAMLYRVDPTPVKAIGLLKSALSKSQ